LTLITYWVVDVVPLSRAVLLGLGDDGMLGGLNAGVAWGEPARDCCGLRGGQVCLFVFYKGRPDQNQAQ
jgi:hypothetical protein